VPKDGFADMKVDYSTKQAVQAGMSEQMIDSVMNYVQETGIIYATLNKTNVPPNVNLNLTTDAFDVFLPGMVARYGSGEDIEILFSTYEAPQALIGDEKIGTML